MVETNKVKPKECYLIGQDNVQIFNKTTETNNKVTYLNRKKGARCSSVVRAFAHGAMGRRIDPSWGEPIELFLVPASAPRLV